VSLRHFRRFVLNIVHVNMLSIVRNSAYPCKQLCVHVAKEARRQRLMKARARARTMALKKRRAENKVSSESWIGIQSVFAEWSSYLHSKLRLFHCCAYCGASHFPIFKDKHSGSYHKGGISFVDASASYSSYAFANVFIADHVGRGTDKWSVCKSCKKNSSRYLQFTVFMSPSYMVALFSVNVLQAQMLSIVDVNLPLLSRWNGFAHGIVETTSLLDNSLITWNSHLAGEIQPSSLPVILQHILRHNIIFPLIRKYQPLLEIPHPKYAVPVPDSSTIQHIIADNIARAPIKISAMDDDCVSSLLATSEFAHHSFNSNNCVPKSKLFDVSFDTLQKTGVQKRLKLHANGFPSLQSEACNLSIKTVLFPFLFPFGKGTYAKGKGVTFTDYLRMRMMAMFSPFTLFTPYLLLMYQVRKAFVLIAESRDVAYESAVKRYQKKFPGCTDNQVFLHVLKHDVPRTIAGSLSWHRRNLKDLLCMVDYWGLPQLFLLRG
jgi:hypothetical protein